MQKTIISTPKAPAAIGPYSQAVKIGNVLYTSGQIALTPETMEVISGGITEQSKQVLDNLVQVLAAADVDMESVVKTTCFLSDMNNFADFNEVYATYFSDQPPARSCVEVSRLPKDVLVEVEAIAIINA